VPIGRAVSTWQAAADVVAVQTRLAQAGMGMAQAAMAGATRCETLRHYPRADVIDRANGSQFYYHAHGSRRCPPNEHGHFHLFARNLAGEASFSHLAALSLDAQGWPLRWFCTNRWVTGEHWLPAAQLIEALAGFQPRTTGRLAPVAQWLAAMVHLYADGLAALLRRRDRLMAGRLAHMPAETLFEDRRLDVITETQVALPARLQQLAGLARH